MNILLILLILFISIQIATLPALWNPNVPTIEKRCALPVVCLVFGFRKLCYFLMRTLSFAIVVLGFLSRTSHMIGIRSPKHLFPVPESEDDQESLAISVTGSSPLDAFINTLTEIKEKNSVCGIAISPEYASSLLDELASHNIMQEKMSA